MCASGTPASGLSPCCSGALPPVATMGRLSLAKGVDHDGLDGVQMVCSWSNTSEAGEVNTELVTSAPSRPCSAYSCSPRIVSRLCTAGRQCRNFVVALPVAAMRASLTW